MIKIALVLALAACCVSAAPKAGLAPLAYSAPVAYAAPAPAVVTAHSSQYIAQNFNGLAVAAAAPVVCELHFQEQDVKQETTTHDSKMGTLFTAPLPKPRLSEASVDQQERQLPELQSPMPACVEQALARVRQQTSVASKRGPNRHVRPRRMSLAAARDPAAAPPTAPVALAAPATPLWRPWLMLTLPPAQQQPLDRAVSP
ncbi:uncharacterized protein LOC124606194 [Schistocerca americana]|uniref:uncharacterized protein LOC124606194 n=1 Tax=Schistocerca americana TaxID=7009 RepID=UPI001F4F3D0C|nr:uncharacterized protein LOC124606194 [Schistocerca americana]